MLKALSENKTYSMNKLEKKDFCHYADIHSFDYSTNTVLCNILFVLFGVG